MDFKLTSSQLNFYTKNRVLDGSIWNQSVIQMFPKVFTYKQLNDAYNCLVRDNESLRVKFKETAYGLVSYVEDFKHVNFPFIKVGSDEELLEETRKAVNLPIDFYGRLVNCIVFQTPTKSGIIIIAHHIVIDGYCSFVMSEHINEYLRNPEYRPVTQPYADYIEKEEKHKQSKRFLSDREFWKNRFRTNPTCNMFSGENAILDFSSEEFDKDIPIKLLARIKAFCTDNEISPASFFNTVYATYIRRIYDVEKFTIGVPVLNRTTKTELNTIGLYMHIVPLVIDIQSESFIENAKKIEDAWLNIFRHQKFTQYDIRQMLREENMPINTLYDIVADFLEFVPNNDYEIILPYGNNITIPLEFHLQSFNQEKCGLRVCYQTAYFTENEVKIMLDSIVTLMENAIEHPFENINSIEMVSFAEKQTILKEFNDTAVEYSTEQGVYELFENHVTNTPNKLAVVFKDIKLTYSQLNDRVSECADRLSSLNIKANDIVAVHLERSQKLVVFQLAILKIGAIFLPVDKRYPIERIQQMCTNCDVSIFITDEMDKTSIDANVILLNDFNLITPTTKAVTVTNLGDCYIIYTSGSTGVPKGCLLTGKGLLNFCVNNNTLETLNSIENPIFACVNSASFDYFIAETLLPLTNGFTTVILDDNESTIQEPFLKAVLKNNINVIMTTPTRFKIYFNDKCDCYALKNMACLCTSGEPLTVDLLDAMYKKSPDAQVYNPIGPSECSVWDMGGRLEKSDGLDVHIGKPIANVQIYILDKYLNPTPIGVTGEICIAGDGVGSGYINNPELTAEKFIPNPFGTGKLYKTGDLAYWREDGNICYVGRNDFQVKVRGLRIELGEIESVSESINGVECAVAVVRTDNQNRQYICVFYTGKEIDAGDFKTILGAKLPRYMVPQVFIHLEKMPLTSSGKISRNSLPQIDFDSISTETEFVSPETEKEKALAEVVCSVLRTENVNMFDNFFNIGGDSITAIYVVSDLEEKGYELHVADIMQNDTLLDVAKAMKSTSSKAIYDQIQVNGFVPFSPIMRAFLKEKKEIPKDFVHTCVLSADCDEDTVRKALDILVSHHDMLRGAFTDNGIEIYPSDEREVYSFESITINDTEKATEILKDTRLTEDKLMSVVFCKTEKENLVSFTVHHFLIDLVSWEVLIKDFNTVVKQLNNNEEISLPAKTASFKMWSEELAEYSETMPEENKAYWNNVTERLNNAKTLKVSEEINEAEEYSFTFDKETSEKLINEVNNTYGTRTNEVLLTALGLAAGKIADGEVGIIVEGHGRTELHKPIATERTVGWFTSCYPVVINNNDNITEELINVKETMRRIPKNGIEYLLMNEGFHKNTDVIFNFYRNSFEDNNGNKDLVGFNSETSLFPNKISVDCSVIDNILTVNIAVSECNHRLHITEELGLEFKEQIEKIVNICTMNDAIVKTRSDFSDDELTESELDELKDLFDWGDDDEQ